MYVYQNRLLTVMIGLYEIQIIHERTPTRLRLILKRTPEIKVRLRRDGNGIYDMKALTQERAPLCERIYTGKDELE